MRVSVIGLGRTGLPMAVALAHKGMEVVGIDRCERIAQVAKPDWTPREPMCEWQHRKGVQMCCEMEAAADTDLSLLMVGTPEQAAGVMDLSQVETSCRALAAALGDGPHTLVISSTLYPGTARDMVRPLLPPTCNVVVNPVWIAQGSVYADYTSPPVVLLGCDGPMPCIAEDFADSAFGKGGRVFTDTYTAELLKLTHNVWCTTRMSFVNAFAALFDERGADVKALTAFFRNGGERSGRFLVPGTPFGGPCFPRDLRFMAAVCEDDLDIGNLIDFIADTNMDATHRITGDAFMTLRRQRPATVGIAGLAYKPGSDVVEESASTAVAISAQRDGAAVLVYDPNVNGNWRGPGEHAADMADLIARSDVLVEMHPGLVPSDCPKPVIRPWR